MKDTELKDGEIEIRKKIDNGVAKSITIPAVDMIKFEKQ